MKLQLQSFFSKILRIIPRFGGTLVIDLGSSSVKLGLIQDDTWHITQIPSLSVQNRRGDVIVVGEVAQNMIGKLSHDMVLISPIKGGEIGEKKSTEMIIKHGIKKLIEESNKSGRFHFFRKIILLLPSHSTKVQLKVVQQVVSKIGALETTWIPISIAQGWGTGVLNDKKQSAILIDIGGSTTEVSVIAQKSVLNSQTIPIGGDDFTRAITRYCRKELGVEVGQNQAETVKKQLQFSSKNLEDKKSKKNNNNSKERILLVKGRTIQTGLPISLTLKQTQLGPVISEIATELLTALHQVLIDIPPEMGEEVLQAGLVIVGGGGISNGLTELFHQRLRVPVRNESSNIFSAIDGVPRLLANGTTVERKL